ncbi:MAG: YfhO family protein, partial [Lachnospiraceae bacterium]|nr:YfhO family protein [Lachnospiraceae bacterium]
GCEASTNAYSITGSTPLVDSLLSVKYALYSEEVPNTTIQEYMRESGGTYLHENLYTLPLGVVVPRDLNNNWQYTMSNPAEVQNDLCQVLGVENVLVWTESAVNGAVCTFTPDMPGEYYAYVTNKKVKEVTAALPSGEKSFKNVDRGYLLELGTLLDGNEVKLTCETENVQMSVEIYRFSESGLMAFHDVMTQSPFHLTSWTDSKLEGTVHAEEAGALFLSIPYDEGWTVMVDGEDVETYKIFEAFTAVNVEAGDHEVRLTYFPGGLKAGLIISAAAVVILAVLYLTKRKLVEKVKITVENNDLLHEDTIKEEL